LGTPFFTDSTIFSLRSNEYALMLARYPAQHHRNPLRTPSERAKADAVLTERIERIHRDSRGTCGAPRIHAELRVSGIKCARKRVARLMREAGLIGCGGSSRHARTTRRDGLERAPAAPDLLVKRDSVPGAPDRLWVADITYARSWEGWLYLAFVLDAFSRRVVGWSMTNHLRTELVLDALNMAIHNPQA
jgi:putative transposase